MVSGDSVPFHAGIESLPLVTRSTISVSVYFACALPAPMAGPWPPLPSGAWQVAQFDWKISAPAGLGAAPSEPPPSDDEDDAPAPTQAQAATAEFVGQVTAISGSSITVSGEHGQYQVTLTSDTNVPGSPLTVGATVRVHARAQGNGTLVAAYKAPPQCGKHHARKHNHNY